MNYFFKLLIVVVLIFNRSFSQVLASETSIITGKKVLKKLNLIDKKYTLVFFIEPSCPISKAYMPTLATFEKNSNQIPIQTFYVFPNKFSQRKERLMFLKENNLKSRAIYDNNHLITNALKAKITPEVFLIDQNKTIIYHGAIDNLYYGLGKRRPNVTENYLKDFLAKLENTSKIITNTYNEPFGCDIE